MPITCVKDRMTDTDAHWEDRPRQGDSLACRRLVDAHAKSMSPNQVHSRSSIPFRAPRRERTFRHPMAQVSIVDR